MKLPEVKLCVDCHWSKKIDPERDWEVWCSHPVVNVRDTWFLGTDSPRRAGTNCTEERRKGWRKPCGIKGKLFDRVPDIQEQSDG